MKTPGIKIIKLGFKDAITPYHLTLLEKHFTKSTKKMVYNKYIAGIGYAKIHVHRNGILVISKEHTKETKKQILDILELKPLSYEAIYTGNIGFKLNLEKFNLVPSLY